MLSDRIIQAIRTYVPIGVGAALTWLITLGIELDSEPQTALITGITALCIAAYWALVTALAKRWPWVGWLLGSPKTPSYAPAPEAPTYEQPVRPSVTVTPGMTRDEYRELAGIEYDDGNGGFTRA